MVFNEGWIVARDKVLDHSLYGYIPTEWICILFVVLFSITTVIHIGQAAYYKLWWLYITAGIGGLLEILGWIGRLWSSFASGALNPYLMQICCTIMAPTPFIAANFVILGQIIARLGSAYSRLSAMHYTVIFVSCDIIALTVQSVGGALAATAVQNDKSPAKGGHIMLAGIVFQLAAITVYVTLAAEFVWRFTMDKPLRGTAEGFKHRPENLDKKVQYMLFGLAFSSLCVFIRSVYRTIELSNGWTGRIIHTQVYFNVLDGAMIVLAMFTINAFHPGRLLGPGPTWMMDHKAMFSLHGKNTAGSTALDDSPAGEVDAEKATKA